MVLDSLDLSVADLPTAGADDEAPDWFSKKVILSDFLTARPVAGITAPTSPIWSTQQPARADHSLDTLRGLWGPAPCTTGW